MALLSSPEVTTISLVILPDEVKSNDLLRRNQPLHIGTTNMLPVNPYSRRHRARMYLGSGIYESAALSNRPIQDEALTVLSLWGRSLMTSLCPRTSRDRCLHDPCPY